MGILTLAYLVSLGFLLWVTRAKRAWYTGAKGLTSALFLVCGVWAALAGTQRSQPAIALLLAALVLCAGGDVMLGLANHAKKVRAKPFLAGVVLFGFAHVLFCAMLFLLSGFHLWQLLFPAACLIVLWQLEAKQFVRTKRMRIPAYIYTFLVALMTVKCLAASFTQGLVPGLALAGGGLLFFVSDVILLFLYFGVKRHRLLRYANLASYYLGVYLLAIFAYWL